MRSCCFASAMRCDATSGCTCVVGLLVPRFPTTLPGGMDLGRVQYEQKDRYRSPGCRLSSDHGTVADDYPVDAKVGR